jgi:uncharacterized protein (TIGR02145 family)
MDNENYDAMKHYKLFLFALLLSVASACNNDEDDENPNESNSLYCDSITSITDSRDGQTYEIVQIGDQRWFAENLRYTPPNIPPDSSTSSWFFDAPEPKWCWYDNNPDNDAVYGKLYNWYAVTLSGFCPEGWHIPSDEDWQILEYELGMTNSELDSLGHRGTSQNVGGKMKAISSYNAPNLGATNESCFSALAGGLLLGSEFSTEGYLSYWWSSTTDQIFNATAYSRSLISNNTGVGRWNNLKMSGFYCRCVKD